MHLTSNRTERRDEEKSRKVQTTGLIRSSDTQSLKSVHFKKTVAQSSFLSKVLSFLLTLFWFQQNDNTFERNEDCATVFLKWTDFKYIFNLNELKNNKFLLIKIKYTKCTANWKNSTNWRKFPICTWQDHYIFINYKDLQKFESFIQSNK